MAAAKKPKFHAKISHLIKNTETRAKITDVFVNPSFKIESINTGSTIMNMLIGGSKTRDGSFVCPGYPRGHIIEIFGRESSGKSTLALTAMAHAVAENGCGLYVDLECAVKDNYAMKLGVDFRPPEMGGPGNVIRAQPRSFEETEQIVTMAAAQGIDLIVIDSVAGLVSNREVKRNVAKDSVAVAEIPRLMSQWMPKLQAQIAKSGSTVIFLNQTRDKIGAMGYNEETLKSTVGGNALKFWAAVRMLLTPKKSMKAKVFNPILKEQEEVQIATDIRIKMIKNKIDAKQGHIGMVTIRYGIGIDELLTMMNVAQAYDIISKSKNNRKQDVFSFKYSDGKIEEIGIEKFRLALQRNKAALEEMLTMSQEKIISGYRIIDDEQLAELADGESVTTFMDHDEEDERDYEDHSSEPDVVEVDNPDFSDLIEA